jgi:hypothetical protein
MRIKNGDLALTIDALTTLSKEKFPIAYSFKLSRLLKKIATYAEIYAESREQLIDDYARRDENGEKVTSNNGTSFEMQGNWREELRELDAIETDEFDGLSTKELIKQCEAGKINIQGITLYGLADILIEDMEEENENSKTKE